MGLKNKTWLGLLLLGSADIAFSQSTATRPPSFGAAPRANAGAPVRQIGIRAAVDAAYDSNVFGVSDALIDQGSLQGRSKDDISVTPSLLLDIVLPFGRQSAFARGQIGYDFYLDNSQLNRERIVLELGANLQVLGSCSTTVSGSYGRFRSNSGDVFIARPGLVSDPDNVEEQKTIGVQGQCGSAIGLSPSFGYQHSETRNSSRFFELNDSNQDSFDASIGYQRPSLGRIAIYGTYAEGEYLRRDIDGNSRTFFPIIDLPNPFFNPNALDGVKSYSAGLRFERNIGSRASGAIAIGYSWVDPKARFAQRFRGNSYSLNLNLLPTDRLSIDVLVTRSADLSNTVFSSFSVSEVYSVNNTYRLNRKLAVNYGASHQKRDFRQSAPTPDFLNFVSKDKFTRAYVGFLYNLNDRINLTGLVSQQRRQSDRRLFDYNNTTVSLGASLSLGR